MVQSNKAGHGNLIYYLSWCLTAVSIIIALYTIFFKLGEYPIYIWDEAIYANNSLEMAKSGNPLVYTLDGVISNYNSKPPLVIWAQAVFIKLLGPTEFAIRLPSALAALGICIVMLLFAHKTLNNLITGALSVIVLTTSSGFIRNHFTRTGDLDAVVVFWITLYTCLAFHYIIKKPLNYKLYFSVITICIVMAFYSKSVAGLLPLPGILLASISNRSLSSILKIKYLYKCIFFGVISCLIYYVVKELLDPGYLKIAYESEYMRFFKNIMPWHEQPIHHYFSNLYHKKFLVPYIFILPIMIWFSLLSKETKTITSFCVIFCLSYLVILTIPANKLEWYDAPIYPFISIITGIGIYNVIKTIYQKTNKNMIAVILSSLFFVVFFAWGFKIVDERIRNNNNVIIQPLEREGYFMKDLHQNRPDVSKYTVLMHVEHDAHLTHAKFYRTAYNMSGNHEIIVSTQLDSIETGQTYLFCQDTIKRLMATKFIVDTISSNGSGCNIVKITGEQ